MIQQIQANITQLIAAKPQCSRPSFSSAINTNMAHLTNDTVYFGNKSGNPNTNTNPPKTVSSSGKK